MKDAPHIVVVGTINIDRVWQVPVMPRPGETVLATQVRREFGGKGANQAVAAARQGAEVTLVGALGDDAEGRLYREHLGRERIDTACIATDPTEPTGTAHVYVDPAGENSIVVSRGANARVDGAFVRAALQPLRLPQAVLVQLECPRDGAVAALEFAAAHGIRGVLNASPVDAGFPWGMLAIDTLIVNAHECAAALSCGPEALCGMAPADRQRLLAARRLTHVVVTRGADPTLHVTAQAIDAVPTLPVQPVDTVGAGDTFAGILATGLAFRLAWESAIADANAGAALSTLAVGAQSAMPTRLDILRHRER